MSGYPKYLNGDKEHPRIVHHKCRKCGKKSVYFAYSISGTQTRGGYEEDVDVDVIVCSKCGTEEGY